MEKEMATHSSVLAWRIPGMGSLVGCHPLDCTESDTTEVTQQQQQYKTLQNVSTPCTCAVLLQKILTSLCSTLFILFGFDF